MSSSRADRDEDAPATQALADTPMELWSYTSAAPAQQTTGSVLTSDVGKNTQAIHTPATVFRNHALGLPAEPCIVSCYDCMLPKLCCAYLPGANAGPSKQPVEQMASRKMAAPTESGLHLAISRPSLKPSEVLISRASLFYCATFPAHAGFPSSREPLLPSLSPNRRTNSNLLLRLSGWGWNSLWAYAVLLQTAFWSYSQWQIYSTLHLCKLWRRHPECASRDPRRLKSPVRCHLWPGCRLPAERERSARQGQERPSPEAAVGRPKAHTCRSEALAARPWPAPR